MSETNNKLVDVNDLYVQFHVLNGIVPAVNGVSFSIRKNQTLGIVGESGCGKSVTALALLGLIPNPPGKITNGEIFYHREDGQTLDIAKTPSTGPMIRSIRGNEISMIFQEPMNSLTPAYSIGQQIGEAVKLHQRLSDQQSREAAISILDRVGMPQPERVVDSYPHQLSGGMMQRAMIAIALSCRPSLLIADEPTTALDVTTAAIIQELMKRLQDEFGMAIMYITHDLGVIAEMAEDVVVMYMGRIVERTDVDSLFYEPKHPYTRGLLESIPKINQRSDLQPIRGVVPEPYALPPGCVFGPRCPSFMAGVCDGKEPRLRPVESNHEVRCYLYETSEVR
jgi:oligopeptide/dipeptide ABC transporter ATP-binding protein